MSVPVLSLCVLSMQRFEGWTLWLINHTSEVGSSHRNIVPVKQSLERVSYQSQRRGYLGLHCYTRCSFVHLTRMSQTFKVSFAFNPCFKIPKLLRMSFCHTETVGCVVERGQGRVSSHPLDRYCRLLVTVQCPSLARNKAGDHTAPLISSPVMTALCSGDLIRAGDGGALTAS